MSTTNEFRTSDNNNFEVGSRVRHDYSRTLGTIKDIHENVPYPYFVVWDDGSKADWFSADVLEPVMTDTPTNQPEALAELQEDIRNSAENFSMALDVNDIAEANRQIDAILARVVAYGAEQKRAEGFALAGKYRSILANGWSTERLIEILDQDAAYYQPQQQNGGK